MPRTLLTGIATLTLAMTRKFNCHCEIRSAAAIPWNKVWSIYRALLFPFVGVADTFTDDTEKLLYFKNAQIKIRIFFVFDFKRSNLI